MTPGRMNLAQAAKTYFETRNMAPMRRAVVYQTGELADAVRDVLKGGRHNGPCKWDLHVPGEQGFACSIHVATARIRQARLMQLTEKALRGIFVPEDEGTQP